jgi:type VI secretion system protein ImpL
VIRVLSEKLARVTGMQLPRARALVIGGLTVPLLAGLGAVLWWVAPRVPAEVWVVITVAALAVLVMWLVVVGLPRYRKRRFSRTPRRDVVTANASEEEASAARMRERLEEARDIWERSPELSAGTQTLYRMPFYLVLGDDAAAQENWLRMAAETSPLAPPKRSDREWLVWWFHKDAVAIETSPAFPCDQGDERTRGVWYQALQLLRDARPLQPLNGFVLLVSAQALLHDADGVRDYGKRLRRLMDEALAQLEIVAPAYVVVTGIEALEGAESFLSQLPDVVRDQVLGHVFAEPKIGQGAWEEAPAAFEGVLARLHALRLGMMAKDLSPKVRDEVYRFVSGFEALGPGLAAFGKALLEETPALRQVAWRGLFFTGVKSRAAFVADLFLRFLPADQPLAHRTGRRRAITWLGVVALAAFAATLSAGLVWRLQVSHDEDQTALQAVEGACGRLAGSVTGLADLDSCRAEVEKLEATAKARSFSLGLNASDRKARRLREAFVSGYRTRVLAAVDQSIDTAMAQKKTSFIEPAAIAQRLWLIERCQDRPEDCTAGSGGVVFVAASPQDFPVVGSGGMSAEAAAAAGLAFARWVPKTVAAEERERGRKRLASLLAQGFPSVGALNAWGQSRLPVTVSGEIWRPRLIADGPRIHVSEAQRPVSGLTTLAEELAALGNVAKVEGGTRLASSTTSEGAGTSRPGASGESDGLPGIYRRAFAESVVAPLVQEASRLDARSADSARAFAGGYASNFYGTWGRFLAGFQAGIDAWRDAVPELVQQMASEDTPFSRLHGELRKELVGFEQTWMPAPAWVAALDDALKRDGPALDKAARAVMIAVGQDVNGRESYDLARAMFSGTPGSPEPAGLKDLKSALSKVDRPPAEVQKKMAPGDYGPWSVVQGAGRTAVFLLAYRAVQFLQETWEREVAAGMAGRAPREQQDYLLGSTGRLKWFTDTWLAGFYQPDGLPASVAGVVLPLHTDFQAYLRQLAGDQQKLTSGPVAAGTVQVHPTALGSLAEGPAGTIFELVCQSQKFSAGSKGLSLAETRAMVFWSPRTCQDVTIRIALPLTAESEGMAALGPQSIFLVKTYPGPEGFPAMIRDFKQGPKTFRPADFSSSYGAAQWQVVSQELSKLRIGAVRVDIRLQLSPDMELFLSPPRKAPASLLPARLQ